MFGSSLNYGAGPSGTSSGTNQNQTDLYQQAPYEQQIFLQQPLQVYPPQVYSVLPPQNGSQQILAEHFVFEESLSSHLQMGSGIGELAQAAGKTDSPTKKNRNPNARMLACEICSKDFKNRSLLRKHIVAAHRGDTRLLPSFWCNETNCDFQCDCANALMKHLQENHGRQLDALKMSFNSFSDFSSWKNHLEENKKVKFLLSEGLIMSDKPSTMFLYECHRAGGLGKRSSRDATMDVMEKALQEILPGNRDNGSAYRLEIVEDEEFDCTDVRKGFRRFQNLSPCVAHLRAEVSHISGHVEVEGCLSHYGHDLDRVPRPPDCVLGRLRQQMQKLSRAEIEAQLPSWTKHDLTETTWRHLENQTPSSCTLFAQFRSLLRRSYDHIAVMARTNGQYYWVDQMENLADLFLVEQKLKCIRERMSNKVKAAGGTPHDAHVFGLDLCYSLLSFANSRDQLKKLLKHGLDYADDARSTDVRYTADFTPLIESTVYDPSVLLFKPKPGALPLQELSLHRLRANLTKKSSPPKKQKYARQLVGSDDDSEYDCWSDEEMLDIVPRRWPPAPITKQGSLEEKRIEKNMKRKIVPALDIKPELREKILAMRVLQERETRESEDAIKTKKTTRGEKRRNPRRTTRRARRGRKQSSSEESSDDDSDHDGTSMERFEEDERPSNQEIVLQELRVEGPAGKKTLKVKVLASEVDREVAAIVVEPPTPKPEEPPKRTAMVSLLRSGSSSLRPPSGRSLLKAGGVSLLKPRDPKPAEPCEWKAPTPAPPQDIFERHSIDFDEGPLQTPQPPRIED